MKFRLKNIAKKNSSLIFLFIFGVCVHFFIIFSISKKTALAEIDKNLLRAAKNIKYYLGKDYIKNEMDENTLSADEALKTNLFLNEMANEQGVSYLYIFVKKEKNIYFAAVSDVYEELIKDPKAYYWFDIVKSNNNSFDTTWDAFEKNEPVFLNSSDMWGTYRSVYIPEFSKDGTKYLAGADFTTTSIRKEVLIKTLTSFAGSLIIILLVLPLVLSFRKLSISLKNKARESESRDPMTGVYNKKSGFEILKTYSELYSIKTVPISICFIDIEDLGYINKKMGLKSGDDIIKIVARLISMSFRKTDVVIRLEGDKFSVILPDYNPEANKFLLKNLEERLLNFNKLNKKDYFINLHIFLSEYKNEDIDEFINTSLIHMELQKKNKPISETYLEEEILDGLKLGQFKTFFQPKVFLEKKTVEFEALIRWFHPEKGIIPPNKFINIAENSFLIYKITEMTLIDSLKAAENMGTRISLNISPVVFKSPYFVKNMTKILNSSRFSHLITFEITEGIAVKNRSSTLEKIHQLADLGIKFSIDDFGTGYSSLSYLENLPIYELKIDKSFIQNVGKNNLNSLIISFIVKAGKISGFKVVAEGTETKEQIEKLIDLGCYNFQGYYFDKALPLEEVSEKILSDFYLKKIESFHLNTKKIINEFYEKNNPKNIQNNFY